MASVLEAIESLDSKLEELLRLLYAFGPLNEDEVTSFRSARFGLRKREYRRTVNSIIRRLRRGLITPMEAATLFRVAYRRVAEEAFVIGLERMGGEFSSVHRAIITREVEKTTRFFRKFADDIATDSVKHTWGIAGRTKFYVDRANVIRSKGFVEGGKGTRVLWYWRLSAGDICEDCITLSLLSPFEDTPPSVPGEGHTVCGSACRCVLIREESDVDEHFKAIDVLYDDIDQ
jgi:hypothetical protein